MSWRTPVLLTLLACCAIAPGCATPPPSPPARLQTEKLPPLREGPEFPGLQVALGSQGELYMAFVSLDRRANLLQLLFNRSTDFGATWDGPPTLLFSTNDQDVSITPPVIRTDGKKGVYLAWRWKRKGFKQLYVARSPDGGRTWLDQATNLHIPGQPFQPFFLADPDGHLHLLWRDEQAERQGLWFSASADSGRTWRPDAFRLTASSPPTLRFYSPGLASDGKGHVYAAWHELDRERDFTHRILLNRSADFGASWWASATIVRSTPHSSPPWPVNPLPFADTGGHAYLTWEEYGVGDNYDLYFARSDDYGVTWQPKVRLNSTLPGQAMVRYHHLAFDGRGNLYAVWVAEGKREVSITFRRSADFGQTWGPEQRLDVGKEKGAQSHFPAIVADAQGRLVVVWQQAWLDGWTLYMNRSDDFGATWLPRPLRLDSLPQRTPRARRGQLLGDQAGHVYLVWDGDPFGKDDFFLTRSWDHGKTWLPKEHWLTNPSTFGLIQHDKVQPGVVSRP